MLKVGRVGYEAMLQPAGDGQQFIKSAFRGLIVILATGVIQASKRMITHNDHNNW